MLLPISVTFVGLKEDVLRLSPMPPHTNAGGLAEDTSKRREPVQTAGLSILPQLVHLEFWTTLYGRLELSERYLRIPVSIHLNQNISRSPVTQHLCHS